jgi:hypothetical protein
VPTGLERARPEAEPLGRQQDAPDPEHALGSRRCGTDFGDRERPLKRAADLCEGEDQVSGAGASLVTEGLRARRFGTRRASDSACARSHPTNLLMAA